MCVSAHARIKKIIIIVEREILVDEKQILFHQSRLPAIEL